MDLWTRPAQNNTHDLAERRMILHRDGQNPGMIHQIANQKQDD